MQGAESDFLQNKSQLLTKSLKIRLNFRYYSPQKDYVRVSLNSEDDMTNRSSKVLDENKIDFENKKIFFSQESTTFYHQNQNEIKKSLLKVYQQFQQKLLRGKNNSTVKVVKIQLSQAKNKRFYQIDKRRKKQEQIQKIIQKPQINRIHPHSRKIQITLKSLEENSEINFFPTLNKNIRIPKNSERSGKKYICQTPHQSSSRSRKGIKVLSLKKHKSEMMTPSKRKDISLNSSIHKENGQKFIRLLSSENRCKKKKVILINKVSRKKDEYAKQKS